MKLKYFLSFFALIALLSGCSDDDAMTLLDEIRVSSSYVAIDVEGGSTTITLNAGAAWAFDAEELPEWLTVSPMAGGSGETTVTFSAPATDDGRTTVLHVACADKEQTINVIQGLPSTDVITVREAVAMVQANQNIDKTVIVKGIVCRIDEISTQYGNATYYISDDGSFQGGYSANGSGDGNWLEIYRGYWIDGERFTDEHAFEVGDEMVITGVLMSYKGIPEIKEKTGQVVSITKSLIKVEGYDPENATIPLEGGTVAVSLSCKTNNGISVEIPDEAKNWLGIESIVGGAEPVVTFHANANTGGDRNVSVVFKTTDDDGKEYTAGATIYQKGAIIACTVAEFLAAEVGDNQYRLNAVVNGMYEYNGNIQGFYIRDYTNSVTLVYKPSGFTGTEVKPGDIVTVVGKRGAYHDSPQMVSGVLEDINPVTRVTIEEFLAKPEESNVYYMLTGIIDEITNPQYGDMILKDATNQVSVYGCYPGWGATGENRKYWLQTAGIEEGDEISIIGLRGSHNGNPQLSYGIYFSHTKQDD